MSASPGCSRIHPLCLDSACFDPHWTCFCCFCNLGGSHISSETALCCNSWSCCLAVREKRRPFPASQWWWLQTRGDWRGSSEKGTLKPQTYGHNFPFYTSAHAHTGSHNITVSRFGKYLPLSSISLQSILLSILRSEQLTWDRRDNCAYLEKIRRSWAADEISWRELNISCEILKTCLPWFCATL